MKPKKKVKKVEKKKIESLPVETEIVITSPSTVATEFVVAPFSGDFGRADINLLRDKLNEVIDLLNK